MAGGLPADNYPRARLRLQRSPPMARFEVGFVGSLARLRRGLKQGLTAALPAFTPTGYRSRHQLLLSMTTFNAGCGSYLIRSYPHRVSASASAPIADNKA